MSKQSATEKKSYRANPTSHRLEASDNKDTQLDSCMGLPVVTMNGFSVPLTASALCGFEHQDTSESSQDIEAFMSSPGVAEVRQITPAWVHCIPSHMSSMFQVLDS